MHCHHLVTWECWVWFWLGSCLLPLSSRLKSSLRSIHPQSNFCLFKGCFFCVLLLVSFFASFCYKARSCNYFYSILFQDPKWTFDSALSSCVVSAGHMPWRSPLNRPGSSHCLHSESDTVTYLLLRCLLTGRLENVFLCYWQGAIMPVTGSCSHMTHIQNMLNTAGRAPGEFCPLSPPLLKAKQVSFSHPVRVC